MDDKCIMENLLLTEKGYVTCMSTEPSSLPQLMCIRPLTRH